MFGKFHKYNSKNRDLLQSPGASSDIFIKKPLPDSTVNIIARQDTWKPRISPELVTNGLIGWWRVDEGTSSVINDASGYQTPGAINGTISWIPGYFNQTLDFNGTNTFINYTNNISRFTQLSGTSFSISLWIQFNSSPNVGEHPILSIASTNTENNHLHIVRRIPSNPTNPNKIAFDFWNNSVHTLSNVEDNRWYHVVCTFNTTDGITGTMSIYLNGTLDNTKLGANVLSLPTVNSMYLGRFNTNYVAQNISDVRIYSRCLTDSEIQLLYQTGAANPNYSSTISNALIRTENIPAHVWDTKYFLSDSGLTDPIGLPITHKPPTRYNNLARWWPLNESSGSSGLDYSGNGGHLTLVNTTWENDNIIGPHVKNSSTGYLVTTSSSNIQSGLNIVSQVSLCLWVKSSSATWNVSDAIINQRDITNTNSAFRLSSNSGTNQISMRIFTSTANSVVTANSSVTGGITNWNHYTGTYDGSYIRTYINGQLANIVAVTRAGVIGPVFPLTQPIYIGYDYTGGTARYLTASYADVRVYNTALTETDIMSIMQERVPSGNAYISPQFGANLSSQFDRRATITSDEIRGNDIVLQLTGRSSALGSGGVIDYSGQLHHAAINGTVTYSTAESIVGTGQNSLLFTAGFLTCNGWVSNGTPFMGPAGTTPRTISAWINPTALGTGLDNPIISYGNVSVSKGVLDVYLDSAGNIAVALDSSNLGGYVTKFNTQLPQNKWSYVNVVIDPETYPNSADQAILCYTGNTTSQPALNSKISLTDIITSPTTLKAWYPLNDVSPSTIYDASTQNNSGTVGGQWNRWLFDASNIQLARCTASAAVLNNNIYLIGGLPVANAGTASTATMEVFNGTQWTYGPSLPIPLYTFGCAVHNGSIYVVGGQTTGNAYSANTYMFDGTRWSQVASLSNVRAGLSCVSFNGFLYALAGETTGSIRLNTVSRYDTAANTWTNVGSLPAQLWRFTATVYRGQIWVMGGLNNGVVSANTYYSTNGTTWVAGPSLVNTLYSPGQCTVLNDAIYVLGGQTVGGTVMSNVQVYNGSTWQVRAGTANVVRELAIVTYNNKIYRLGGTPTTSVATTYSNIEVYGPVTSTYTNTITTLFNGTNGNITIPNSAAISSQITTGLTLSAWVNYGSITNPQIIVGKAANNTNTSPFYNYGLQKTAANLHQFRVDTGTITTNTAVTTGTWYHVVGTFDSSTLKIYENGALINTVAYVTPVTTSTSVLKIGANVLNNEFFNGNISDVRIYNTAFTSDQVQALYRQNYNKISTATDNAGVTGCVQIGRGITGTITGSNTFAGYMDDIRVYNKALSHWEIQKYWNGGSGSYLTGIDSALARYNINPNTTSTVTSYYSNITFTASTTFGTPYQAPSQAFTFSTFALSGNVLTYYPASTSTYTWTRTSNTAWTSTPPFSTASATRITSVTSGSLDDGFFTHNFVGGATFPFYGLNKSTVYIGTNGYLTFDTGDGGINTTQTQHYTRLRIGYYEMDLFPSASGTVGILNYGYNNDKFIVTLQNLPTYGARSSLTDLTNIQVVLYLSNSSSPGVISVFYGACHTPNGGNWVAGLSDRTTGVLPTDGSASVTLSAGSGSNTSTITVSQAPRFIQSNIMDCSASLNNLQIVSHDTTNTWVSSSNTIISVTPQNLAYGARTWWKFSETSSNLAIDYSGVTNYATLNTNNVTRVEGPFNQSAISLNGTSDFYSSFTSVNLTTGSTNALTIAAWIRSNSAATWTTTASVFSQRTSGDLNTTALFITTSGTKSVAPRFFSALNTGFGPASIILNDITQWNHVCGVFDGTAIYTYVNGILVDTTAASFTLQSVNKPLLIGKDNTGAADVYLQVNVSDFRIYNRALASTEITQLYNLSPQYHTDTVVGTHSLQLYGTPTLGARYGRWGVIRPASNSSALTVSTWIKPDYLSSHTVAAGNNWFLSIMPPRPQHLQAWYLLNEGDNGAVGYNNGLTGVSGQYVLQMGGTGIVPWVAMPYGGILSAYFDINNLMYFTVDTGASGVSQAMAGNRCTIAAWYNKFTIAGFNMSIVSIESTSSQNSFYLYVNTSGFLEFKAGATVLTTGFSPSGWCHLAVTVDVRSVVIYVNGVSVYTGSLAANLQINSNDAIYIGGNLLTGDYSVNYICDVKFYNINLTPTEIQQIYERTYSPVFMYNTTGTTRLPLISPAVTIASNTWTHVGLTYDSVSSSASMYINGMYVGSNTIAGTVSIGNRTLNIASNIYIGAKPISLSAPATITGHLNGKVCDIRVYPKCLSESTIRQIYQGNYQSVLQLDAYNTLLSDGTMYAQLKDTPTKSIGKGTHNLVLTSGESLPPSIPIPFNYGSGNMIPLTSSLTNGKIFINMGASDYLVTAPSRVFTITGWINVPLDNTVNLTGNIISKWNYSGTQCYNLFYNHTAQTLSFAVGYGANTTTVTTGFAKGATYHVAAVCTGNYGQCLLYLNGILCAGPAAIPGIINISAVTPISIGRNALVFTSGRYFVGNIADLRFYEQALTQTAIQGIIADYQNRNELIPNTNTLFGPVTSAFGSKQLDSDIILWLKPDTVPRAPVLTTYSLADSSPYNNRIVLNNISLVNNRFNENTTYNKAIKLTGSGNSNIIINPSQLSSKLISGTGITAAFWVQFTNPVVTGASETLFQLTGAAGTTGNNLEIRRSLAGSNIVVIAGDVSESGSVDQQIRDTNWNHIAVTYSGNSSPGNRTTYINGRPYASSQWIMPTSFASTIAIIGNNSFGTSGANCAIDDFRLYNRALTIAEIQELASSNTTISNQQPVSLSSKMAAANQQLYVSKYTMDNTGAIINTPLPELARDTLLVNYTGQVQSGSTTTLENLAVNSKPEVNYKNPGYLSSSVQLDYTSGLLNSNASSIMGQQRYNSVIDFNSNGTGNLAVNNLSMNMAKDWTLAFWAFNSNNYTSSVNGVQDIWTNNWSNPTTAFSSRLHINNIQGGLVTYFAANNQYTSNAYLVPNKWTHLAISKGTIGLASNVVSIYQNGYLTWRNQINMQTQSTQSMVWGANTGNTFIGQMTDIRVYTSQLNEHQIARLAANLNNINSAASSDTTSTTGNQPPICGPIHHWKFTNRNALNTIIDLGTAGSFLKLSNVAVTDSTQLPAGGLNTSNIGLIGGGYFAGSTGSYAVAPSALGILLDSPRTVAFWLKRAVNTAPATEEALVSWGASTVPNGWFTVMLTTGGIPAVKTSAAAASNVQASVSILDTSWTHIAAVVLPTGTSATEATMNNVRIFVDGENRTNISTLSSTAINTLATGIQTNGWVTLGGGSTGGYAFNGHLDDVRIYDVALTPAEIRALYNNSTNYGMD